MPKPSIARVFISVTQPLPPRGVQADSRTVLVISPHPDDDVIGMGGTMALLARRGVAVFVLYLTAGRSPLCARKDRGPVRRREALAALKVVKAAGAFFLDYSSGRLKGAGGLGAQRSITAIVEALNPEAVYVPAPFERHATHRAATEIAVRAVRALKGHHMQLWGYSVWGGVWPAGGTRVMVIDISGVVTLKRRALRKHASQLAFKPYDEGIIGRNRYEGIFQETHGRTFFPYAETFLDLQAVVRSRALSCEGFVKKLLKIPHLRSE